MKEQRGPLPVKVGTPHMVRLMGLSGQFKAKGWQGIPGNALYVCSHVDCANRTWPGEKALLDAHAADGPVHVYGAWAPGQAFAPGSLYAPMPAPPEAFDWRPNETIPEDHYAL